MSDKPTIFLVDELVAQPGQGEALLQAYRARYVPGAQARGLTLVHQLVSPLLWLSEQSNTLLFLLSAADCVFSVAAPQTTPAPAPSPHREGCSGRRRRTDAGAQFLKEPYMGAAGDIRPAFTPVRIGPLTLRNRLIKAGANEGMTPDGMPNKALVKHHRDVAAGGVAMTTVAYGAVAPDGRTFAHQFHMHDVVVPHLRVLTDAVHREGAAACLQITHGGSFTMMRQAVSMPLAIVGGVKSTQSAQRALAEGFDCIALARALIHDPAFVRKLGSGEVTPGCTSCNRCAALIYDPAGVRCVLGAPNDPALSRVLAGAP